MDPYPIIRQRSHARRLIEIGALCAILLLAAYLRLAHQPDNPGWYSDEATHVVIARHLLAGRVQYFAVQDSVFLFARPPLFGLTLAGVMTLTGDTGFGALRLLTGGLGVVAVLLLYAVTRRLAPHDPVLALLTACVLAIYPQAVLYTRFGFSYALLAPLVILTLYGTAHYTQTRQLRGLLLASGAVGVGLTGDLMMGSLLPAVILIALGGMLRYGASRREMLKLLWCIPLLVAPFLLFIGWMLLTAPDAFLFDLHYTLTRLNTLTLTDQIANIGRNITVLLAQDGWMMAAAVGLWLLRPGYLRAAALVLLVVPVILLGRTVALYSLSSHYVTPLLPLVALGVGALVRYGGAYIAGEAGKFFEPIAHETSAWANSKRPNEWDNGMTAISSRPLRAARYFLARILVLRAGSVIALLIVVVPLITALGFTLEYVNTRYPTAIDPFLIAPQDARNVIDYLNGHTRDNDLVIASPSIGWALHANAADFQMSVAAEGIVTPHLPGNIPPERFAFDPRFSQARFVVVDNWWHSWGALHVPTLAEKLREIELTWTPVYESDALLVYSNSTVGASITPIAQNNP